MKKAEVAVRPSRIPASSNRELSFVLAYEDVSLHLVTKLLERFSISL